MFYGWIGWYGLLYCQEWGAAKSFTLVLVSLKTLAVHDINAARFSLYEINILVYKYIWCQMENGNAFIWSAVILLDKLLSTQDQPILIDVFLYLMLKSISFFRLLWCIVYTLSINPSFSRYNTTNDQIISTIFHNWIKKYLFYLNFLQ